MNAKLSRFLIMHVGGSRAFADALGLDYDEPGAPQRIHNWKKRGLPNAVVATHYEKLKRLKRQAGL